MNGHTEGSEVRELVDKQAIADLVRRYATAVDSGDGAKLKSIFHPSAKIALLEERARDEFCDNVITMGKTIKTQHYLMNTVSDIKGNSAVSGSYFVAYHLIPAGCDDPTCVAIFKRHEIDMDVTIGGSYLDRLIKTSSGWQIVDRQICMTWKQFVPTAYSPEPSWLSNFKQ